MITSKERAYLRSQASTMDTIVMVGKGGITDNVIAETAAVLKARELIKGKVLESSMLTSREACQILAEKCGAEPVQAIGSKFVLYKENKDIPAEKRIKLKK
jgi:RNA-binding protein